ncbi:hypothetical protein [Pseudomonas typographi]|uniref:Uncharacterized protein n=1 Tax=Pseudomonas typographi TaxID=2715964 RepID=A0ABR7YYS8_9PSED|nr:hypothetical protein [Pseudomonas typographi]MBD1550848.1 hypothetical protein [Pseudomonas typographi]MBD1587790.1 hypothetical protein [Pseudomonas typographi]MBD1598313.1 hypothetical protein [Pseudomonas typographi]
MNDAYDAAFNDISENIRPLLVQLLAEHTELAGVTPETLFINGIDPASGTVIDSQSLLHATVHRIIERDPPEYHAGYPHAGVFTQAYTFDDAFRVEPTFQAIDFWYIVGQAYDAA